MIVVHHLETSRSTRILWLMEELGIEYEMVRHARVNRIAPPELREIHPLGKAPFIVDGDLVLAESSAILRYVDARYGGGRLSLPAGTPEGALHDEWLDFAEGSLTLPLMLGMMGQFMGELPEGLAAFSAARGKAMLRHIGDRIGDGPYLMGDRLTLADIQMSYTLEIARLVGLLDCHPGTQAYFERLLKEPGLQRAIELGGPMSMEIPR